MSLVYMLQRILKRKCGVHALENFEEEVSDLFYNELQKQLDMYNNMDSVVDVYKRQNVLRTTRYNS